MDPKNDPSPTSLLNDLTSGDPEKIWSASSAVVHLRDTDALDVLAAHISEIRDKTNDVELGGLLYSNRDRLKFVLKKLTFIKNRKGCLCHLYPDYLMYNPNDEAEKGNVRIIDTTYVEGKWVDFYTCQCLLCGTQFRVEEREYHYTWWEWKIVTKGTNDTGRHA